MNVSILPDDPKRDVLRDLAPRVDVDRNAAFGIIESVSVAYYLERLLYSPAESPSEVARNRKAPLLRDLRSGNPFRIRRRLDDLRNPKSLEGREYWSEIFGAAETMLARIEPWDSIGLPDFPKQVPAPADWPVPFRWPIDEQFDLVARDPTPQRLAWVEAVVEVAEVESFVKPAVVGKKTPDEAYWRYLKALRDLWFRASRLTEDVEPSSIPDNLVRFVVQCVYQLQRIVADHPHGCEEWRSPPPASSFDAVEKALKRARSAHGTLWPVVTLDCRSLDEA